MQADSKKSTQNLKTGHLFGKFYLLEQIGEGATASIYKALQQPINRVVALKIPDFDKPGDLLTPNEFLSEAMSMAKLEHENIARIYDFGTVAESAFICMEFIEGDNIVDFVDRFGPLPPEAAIPIALQVCEGLQFAHSKGILHRDLSPKNILISEHGQVKISDFGMAGKKTLAGDGRIVGTPSFLSPEHVLGLPFAPKSDIFCLGAVWFFMRTGELLFDDQNLTSEQLLDTVQRAREAPPPSLGVLPEWDRDLCAKMLQGVELPSLHEFMRNHLNLKEGSSYAEATLRFRKSHRSEIDFNSLRKTYSRLRSEGEHRRAVALLESALVQQPENHEIRELLQQPWQSPSQAMITKDVTPLISDTGDQTTKSTSRKTQTPWIYWPWGVAVLVLMAVVLLARNTIPRLSPGSDDAPQEETSVPAVPLLTEVPASESHQEVPLPLQAPPEPPPPTEPIEPHSPTLPNPVAQEKKPKNIVTPPIAATKHKPPSAPPSEVKVPERPQVKNSEPHSVPETKAPLPLGTRISIRSAMGPVALTLNDSLTLSSPSPQKGWKVDPGVIRFSALIETSGQTITGAFFMRHGESVTISIHENGTWEKNPS